MRKFKFVGDPESYDQDGLIIGHEYNIDDKIGRLRPVHELAELWPKDWQEVTEPEMPNQDQPASSMTKFEMAVLGNVWAIISNPELTTNNHQENAQLAILQAQETFKQLNELK